MFVIYYGGYKVMFFFMVWVCSGMIYVWFGMLILIVGLIEDDVRDLVDKV